MFRDRETDHTEVQALLILQADDVSKRAANVNSSLKHNEWSLSRHQDSASHPLASLKDRCALGDKRGDSLAEICRVATSGNELGLVLHLGFQRLAGAIVE